MARVQDGRDLSILPCVQFLPHSIASNPSMEVRHSIALAGVAASLSCEWTVRIARHKWVGQRGNKAKKGKICKAAAGSLFPKCRRHTRQQGRETRKCDKELGSGTVWTNNAL